MLTTQQRLDDAARNAHTGLSAGERYAHEAVDRITERASGLRDEVTPLVNRLTGRAEDIARQSKQWVRDGSDRVRTQVARTSDRTVGYVRDEPVRSVLIAAAAGAAIYALVRLLSSERSDRYDRYDR